MGIAEQLFEPTTQNPSFPVLPVNFDSRDYCCQLRVRHLLSHVGHGIKLGLELPALLNQVHHGGVKLLESSPSRGQLVGKPFDFRSCAGALNV